MYCVWMFLPAGSVQNRQRESEMTTSIHTCLSLVSGAFICLLVGSALAADREQYERNWPQWRGPAANGLVLRGNPPLNWAEGKNVKWKVAIPGLGHATPVIWEN